MERILWVDAICINQACPLEKTQQVSQMRNIYQATERVLVWLGDGCVETHRAISWVSNHFEGDEKGLEHLMKTARTIMDGCPESTVDVGDDVLDSGEEITQDRRLQLLKGFNNLLSRPWGSRVWGIQEVVVNSDVIIMCGRSEVSWTTFMALCKESITASLSYKHPWMKALSIAGQLREPSYDSNLLARPRRK